MRGQRAGRERRDAADDLLRHGGGDDGDPPRARGDRTRARAEVLWRLPWTRRRTASAGWLWPRPVGGAPTTKSLVGEPGRAAERRSRDGARAVERPRSARRGQRALRAGGGPR